MLRVYLKSCLCRVDGIFIQLHVEQKLGRVRQEVSDEVFILFIFVILFLNQRERVLVTLDGFLVLATLGKLVALVLYIFCALELRERCLYLLLLWFLWRFLRFRFVEETFYLFLLPQKIAFDLIL